MTQNYKKKLIEVAIPLEAINAASIREKSIRHGHPSTMHLWWARRPLAACRAVLFAQLVDDPSSHPDKFQTDEAVAAERKRLFAIMEELITWENSTNEEVLGRARAEIHQSCNGELPNIYDPFSGGGSIPLEAQRLGLPAYGSDLNPVAVTIGKAMLELPRSFKDQPPIHSEIKIRNHYRFAEGLAEDVNYYGLLVRQRARVKLARFYGISADENGPASKNDNVMTWIWARTVPSPDPAFAHVGVPLISSYLLNSKKKKECGLKPTVDKLNSTYSFDVKELKDNEEIEVAKVGTKAARATFSCIFSGAPITGEYINQMASENKLSYIPIAKVSSQNRGRNYSKIEKEDAHLDELAAQELKNKDLAFLDAKCRGTFGSNAQGRRYGFFTFRDYFTNRQLLALTIFSEEIISLKQTIMDQYLVKNSGAHSEASDYADAVTVYLSCAFDRCVDYWSSVCTWNSAGEKMRNTYGRQGIAMSWDYAEANPFSNSSGNWAGALKWVTKAIENFRPESLGEIKQTSAQDVEYPLNVVVSTDPPYYDNIEYADLSDIFYVWMRQNLKSIYPNTFASLVAPKSEELVATKYRHGGKTAADQFFLEGMSVVISNIAKNCKKDFPTTIYYAFKQSEINDQGISSPGWATFLQAVINSGFSIVGTWPLRTEMASRMVAKGANALANSVVLVCRKQETHAKVVTRAEFIRALKNELPEAISELQKANVSPADMPQSAIGPGIGIFSRYAAILEADDSYMAVKAALQLINAELDEFLNNLHGDFDPDTRFAVSWFEQHGNQNGEFGAANNLATARGISVDSVQRAGIVESTAGKVRILRRDELDPNWDPNSDTRVTIWECCQYLVREYEEGGETAAAMLVKKMGFDRAEAVKDLAYYLYDICSIKRQDAKAATSYNALIAGWNDITRIADSIHDTDTRRQASLF